MIKVLINTNKKLQKEYQWREAAQSLLKPQHHDKNSN